MYDEIIWLITETATTDAVGDLDVSNVERVVFAELKSIGQSEFYQAAALGLKPEIKFVIPDYLDYKGEKIVKYKPFGSDKVQEYRVLRTFRSNNTMEIVCTRGVDNVCS